MFFRLVSHNWKRSWRIYLVWFAFVFLIRLYNMYIYIYIYISSSLRVHVLSTLLSVSIFNLLKQFVLVNDFFNVIFGPTDSYFRARANHFASFP